MEDRQHQLGNEPFLHQSLQQKWLKFVGPTIKLFFPGGDFQVKSRGGIYADRKPGSSLHLQIWKRVA